MVPLFRSFSKDGKTAEPPKIYGTGFCGDSSPSAGGQDPVNSEIRFLTDEVHQVLHNIKDPVRGRCAGETPLIAGFNDMEASGLHSGESTGILCRQNVRKMLTEAIEKLPKDEQLLLALYYCEDLGIGEIGEVMGIGQPCVLRLFKRALLDLLTGIRK
jgi:RNA polymerase sigma factor (sigma-70 family)